MEWNMEWTEVVSYAMGLAGALLGLAFLMKFQKAIALLKEFGEALTMAGAVFTQSAEALKDRKITKAESVLLVKAWQEAYAEFKDVHTAIMDLLPASAIRFLFRR